MKRSLTAVALAAALAVTSLVGGQRAEAAPVSDSDAASTGTPGYGDVNGDGRGDVLAIDTSGNLLLYRDLGKSYSELKLGTPQKLYGGWTNINWASKFPDVNGDGYSEILVRRSDDNSLRIYLSDGAGKYRYGDIVGRRWGP